MDLIYEQLRRVHLFREILLYFESNLTNSLILPTFALLHPLLIDTCSAWLRSHRFAICPYCFCLLGCAILCYSIPFAPPASSAVLPKVPLLAVHLLRSFPCRFSLPTLHWDLASVYCTIRIHTRNPCHKYFSVTAGFQNLEINRISILETNSSPYGIIHLSFKLLIII